MRPLALLVSPVRLRLAATAAACGLAVAGPAGADLLPIHVVHGGDTGHYLGYSVSGAGDVNGDLLADVIVGLPATDPNGIDSGSAWVVSGADAAILLNLSGDGAQDNYGLSVSDVGDVDGDEVPDVVVGAPNRRDNAFTPAAAGYARVSSGADGSTIYTFPGDVARDEHGFSVAGAGDVDGDDVPDVVVGAPLNDENGDDAGLARVYSGADGSTICTVLGDSPGDRLGYSVHGAGDVNGDNLDDFIVGMPFDDNTANNAGAARVYSAGDGCFEVHTFDGDAIGHFAGLAVGALGDVNGDDRSDVIVGIPAADPNGIDSGLARVYSGMDGSTLYDFDGTGVQDVFGYSVSGAGDVDGDSVPDAIVGGPNRADGTFDPLAPGVARVFSGADGSTLYSFFGDAARDEFGYSVSGAGDVNGNGLADVVVGAPFASLDIFAASHKGIAPLPNAGEAHVLFNECEDLDEDGWYVTLRGECGPEDCDDEEPDVNPGAEELCKNEIDDNCNDLVDLDDPACMPECTDRDGDGYAVEGGRCGPVDCDDENADVHPQAPEICNEIDDNCNDVVDEGFPMLGEICVVGVGICTREGEYVCSEDGSDVVCSAEAGEPRDEICDNQVDDDCDGLVDAEDPDCEPVVCGCLDLDQDGWVTYYGPCEDEGGAGSDKNLRWLPECESLNDCDDTDPRTHPFAVEIPDDGIDQNCDSNTTCGVLIDSDVPGGARSALAALAAAFGPVVGFVLWRRRRS